MRVNSAGLPRPALGRPHRGHPPPPTPGSGSKETRGLGGGHSLQTLPVQEGSRFPVVPKPPQDGVQSPEGTVEPLYQMSLLSSGSFGSSTRLSGPVSPPGPGPPSRRVQGQGPAPVGSQPARGGHPLTSLQSELLSRDAAHPPLVP